MPTLRDPDLRMGIIMNCDRARRWLRPGAELQGTAHNDSDGAGHDNLQLNILSQSMEGHSGQLELG